jgi:murein DD-endopeptidase MepM/ murein hydrolase activator NlpD
MGLLDNIDFTNPLPDFDVTPDINVSGFLPKFDTLTDFLPKIGNIDLKGFDFFGDMPTMGFSQSFNRGIDWGQNAFRSMLPTWGQGQTNWNMPWDKPVDFQIPGSGQYGVGSASGEAAVLNQYDGAFQAAAARFGMDPNVLKAIAIIERGWGDQNVSIAGAIGIMQIMPNGYHELQAQFPNWKTDPTQNIMLGAAILADKIRSGGSLDMGVQGYLGFGEDAYGTDNNEYLAMFKAEYAKLQSSGGVIGGGAPFTGQAGNSYLSVFGGVSYPISSQHAQHNGAPPSWYYRIDDELGIPIGTHPGLDVAMPNGTTLYMPTGMTGVVQVASGANGYGYDPSGGVARSGDGTGELRILLSNGHILLLGHMQRIFFSPGQQVTGGMALGLSGTAGSGAHVHMEYRIPGATSTGWVAVDPRQYLR